MTWLGIKLKLLGNTQTCSLFTMLLFGTGRKTRAFSKNQEFVFLILLPRSGVESMYVDLVVYEAQMLSAYRMESSP